MSLGMVGIGMEKSCHRKPKCSVLAGTTLMKLRKDQFPKSLAASDAENSPLVVDDEAVAADGIPAKY
jgi:hypothetical protein